MSMNQIPRPIPNWRPSTPPVSSHDFDRVISRHRAVLIHFWAEWNGHDPVCDEKLGPIRSEYADRIQFVSCHIDENPELAERCGVVNVPFLVLYVEGRANPPILRWSDPDFVREVIDRSLNRR